jgi:nucleotide sugar dehydrogenase
MDKVFLTKSEENYQMKTETTLLGKIEDRTALIGVIGLGYVGLTLALGLTEQGYTVAGVDIDSKHLENIRKVNTFTNDEPSGALNEALRAAVRGDKLWLSQHLDLACDIMVVCVPLNTFGRNVKLPHYGNLFTALSQITAVLSNADNTQLVLIESTLPIGTTEEKIIPFLIENNKKVIGQDYHLAYCPERVSIGTLAEDLSRYPRVIGAYSPQCGELAKALYSKITTGGIDITTPVNTEFVKLAEATIRYVNQTLANTFALTCKMSKADVWTVRELVNKVNLWEFLRPGPGVGGHCLSKDAGFLLANNLRLTNTLWETLENLNKSVIMDIVKTIFRSAKAEKKVRIIILGKAYKANVVSVENSGTTKLTEQLKDIPDFSVVAHDPSDYDGLSVEEIAIGAHVIVLMTDHAEYYGNDWQAVAKVVKRPILIDARGMFADSPPKGFEYHCLGIG